MKRLATAVLAFTLASCSGSTIRRVDVLNAALTAEQIACVFGSSVVEAPALAKACGIADGLIPSLVPLLRNLIGQREGARRAGVVWYSYVLDAGADAQP